NQYGRPAVHRHLSVRLVCPPRGRHELECLRRAIPERQQQPPRRRQPPVRRRQRAFPQVVHRHQDVLGAGDEERWRGHLVRLVLTDRSGPRVGDRPPGAGPRPERLTLGWRTLRIRARRASEWIPGSTRWRVGLVSGGRLAVSWALQRNRPGAWASGPLP